MDGKAAGESAHAENAASEGGATKEHHHRGKSSENLLDKALILDTLRIMSGETILDAGCGDGYMSKAFSRALNNTGMVYALDPDEASIAVLKNESEGTRIRALVGDITTTTPLEDSSVDLVYLSTVFHGFSPKQIEGFRNEVTRILKPQARLAIVEIDKRSTPFGPPMDLRFSPGDLQRQIPLTPSLLVRAGEYFYMQVFKNG